MNHLNKNLFFKSFCIFRFFGEFKYIVIGWLVGWFYGISTLVELFYTELILRIIVSNKNVSS